MTAVSLGNNSLVNDAINKAKAHAYEAILTEMESQGIDYSAEDFTINIVALADAVVERLMDERITIPMNISDPLSV